MDVNEVVRELGRAIRERDEARAEVERLRDVATQARGLLQELANMLRERSYPPTHDGRASWSREGRR